MEFKHDKTYTFPEMMAYGFSKDGDHVLADCCLYYSDNSFEGVLTITAEAFHAIIKRSDDKSGAFEKACTDWFGSDSQELFLPDRFPDPVHCKLSALGFKFIKSEVEEDDFDPERIYYFSLESPAA